MIEDLKISMVLASHTSSFPDGTYGGHPAGYVLKFDGKCVYFAGDTGVISEMGILPQLFGKIDCASWRALHDGCRAGCFCFFRVDKNTKSDRLSF